MKIMVQDVAIGVALWLAIILLVLFSGDPSEFIYIDF